MKSRLLVVLLVFVLLGCGIRFVVLVSQTEIGWEMVSETWKSRLLGWVGSDYLPIDQRSQFEQAEFLRSQALAAVEKQPNDPEVLMVSSAILRYAAWCGEKGGEELEADCRSRSMALARRATEIAPADARTWRALVGLLLYDNVYDYDYAKRQAITKPAQEHDPNNAFYDYLAANFLWDESAEFDWEAETPVGYEIRVKDPEAFDSACSRFEQGLNKELIFPDSFNPDAVSRFVRLLGMSRLEARCLYPAAQVSEIGSVQLLRGVTRWQNGRLLLHEKEGDLRQAALMGEHAITPSISIQLAAHASTLSAYDQLVRLHARNGEVFSEEQLNDVCQRQQDANLESQALTVALRARAKAARAAAPAESKVTTLVQKIAAEHLPEVISLALITGLLAWFAARLLRGGTESRDRPLPILFHVLTWTVGFALAVVVFALCPAGIIPPSIQGRTLAAGAVLLFIVPLAMWGVGPLRKFRWRRGSGLFNKCEHCRGAHCGG